MTEGEKPRWNTRGHVTWEQGGQACAHKQIWQKYSGAAVTAQLLQDSDAWGKGHKFDFRENGMATVPSVKRVGVCLATWQSIWQSQSITIPIHLFKKSPVPKIANQFTIGNIMIAINLRIDCFHTPSRKEFHSKKKKKHLLIKS